MDDMVKGISTQVLEETKKVGQEVVKEFGKALTQAPGQIISKPQTQTLNLDQLRGQKDKEDKQKIRRIRRRLWAMQERESRFRVVKQREVVQQRKEIKKEEILQLQRKKPPPLTEVRRQQPETRPGYGG